MTWLLLCCIVVATVCGDLLQSYELKHSRKPGARARGLVGIVRLISSRKYLVLAVVCMAISFFSFMALVRIAPMSFAVPASAATVVLDTLLARLILREHVDARRAAGSVLVCLGVVLLVR